MNLNDYQNDARKTAIAISTEHMVFGLIEEVGEIAGVFKRYHRHDDEYWVDGEDARYVSPFALERLKGELGDALWYLSMLADTLGLTLDEVAKYNLSKLKRRKAKDMIHGSGDDR